MFGWSLTNCVSDSNIVGSSLEGVGDSERGRGGSGGIASEHRLLRVDSVGEDSLSKAKGVNQVSASSSDGLSIGSSEFDVRF